jgi:hypothetical protein
MLAITSNSLTLGEKARLADCEAIIEQGIAVFLEVGNALLEIRDSRLYRQQFPTFEGYCRERWGMVQQSATRLIRAAEVVKNLQSEPIGSLPTTESQARPLTRLEPEVQREVWREVTETTPAEKITAKAVEAKAKEAEPLNAAVKEIKAELKPEPQALFSEPGQQKDPAIKAVTAKVRAGEMTVLEGAKKISQAVIKSEMEAVRALRPSSSDEAPTKPAAESRHDPVFDTVLPNGKPISEGDPRAKFLWGWLLELEDRFLNQAPPPEELAGNFLEFMEQDSARLIPRITAYLNHLLECFHAPVS